MSDHDQPRDRARRRLLKLGAYVPAAIVSLSAMRARAGQRAAPTVGVSPAVSLQAAAQAQVKALLKVKAGG